MKITWRDDTYDFNVTSLNGKADEWNRNSDADAPIFGADTESVETPKGYEPQCFTISSETDGSWYQELSPGCVALYPFLQFIADNHGNRLEDMGKAFIYFHNLEYDWLQLIKYEPKLLEMARIGVSPSSPVTLQKINGYSVILKKEGLFKGSAPHFTLRLERQQGGKRYGFDLKFRDTFSYFPSSLEKASKDLKLPVGKMQRQEDLGVRDFRLEELYTDNGKIINEDKLYFIEYAKLDASNTRLIAEKIRDLHNEQDMTKIRPSSPGFAINCLLHNMGPDRSIISGTNDQDVMQLIFDTYRGGRTGGIYHGKVENIRVYDFHSSYPASMVSLPSFNENMAYVRVENLSLDNVMEILAQTGNAFLRISGTETSSNYPSIITMHNGKLTPIYGRFENIATTGPEFYLGMKTGLIDVTVHEMVVLLDMDDSPFLPFKEFAEGSYKDKAAALKGTVEYIAAKLKLNAAYGKLIESRHNALTSATDGFLFVPFLEGMEKDFGQYYYNKLVEAYEKDSTLEKEYESLCDELMVTFTEEQLSGMTRKMLMDFPLSGMIYGGYVVPAAASLITGISRTRLCAAMKATGALYWDTDSIFVQLDNEMDIDALLQRSDDWLAGGIQKIRVGDELGDLDCECYNAKGVLAGTKRYYLEGVDEKGEPVLKKATHGLPALNMNEAKETLTNLATGKTAGYESRPKPTKPGETKNPEEIGAFRGKRYEPKFNLDSRLHWLKTEQGWMGSVKKLETMEQLTIDPLLKNEILEALQNE